MRQPPAPHTLPIGCAARERPRGRFAWVCGCGCALLWRARALCVSAVWCPPQCVPARFAIKGYDGAAMARLASTSLDILEELQNPLLL